MVKSYVDFELKQPLEKSAEEALDRIIEELLNRTENESAKEIQTLAKAVKDVAITKAILSKIKS